MGKVWKLLKRVLLLQAWLASVVLCVGVSMLWPRSYGHYENVSYRWAGTGTNDLDISHNNGLISCTLQLGNMEDPEGWIMSTQTWGPEPAMAGKKWGFNFGWRRPTPRLALSRLERWRPTGASLRSALSGRPSRFLKESGVACPTGPAAGALPEMLLRPSRHRTGDRCPECGTIFEPVASPPNSPRLRGVVGHLPRHLYLGSLTLGGVLALLFLLRLAVGRDMQLTIPLPGASVVPFVQLGGFGFEVTAHASVGIVELFDLRFRQRRGGVPTVDGEMATTDFPPRPSRIRVFGIRLRNDLQGLA